MQLRWVAIWRNKARRVRASPFLLDHSPVVIAGEFLSAALSHKTPPAQRWDSDKIAKCMQAGYQRESFLEALEEKVAAADLPIKVVD